MKTRVLIAVVPVVVAGGIFLFLGSGAEPPNKNHDESGATDSTTAVAIAPTATDPAPAVPEPVSGIAPAPSKLSAGVDEIVRLAQSGVGDEVLQAYIENSTVAYQLSVDEILYLHDLGLSAQTIAAIVEHGQLLQHQPAIAAANTPSSVTNIVAPSSGPAEPQPAGAPTTEGTSPVPPITDNTQAPANAYTITPPQQVNYNYFYQNLSPYGSWIEVPDCGWCWQPTVAVVDVN